MPINASHEFFSAEKAYLNAEKLEDKIFYLEEMIKTAPKHKGSENLLAELRVRLKKFREKAEKSSKKSGGKRGIRKEGFQFAIVGKTNVGKSTLLSKITNATPLIANYQFTTVHPEIGTFFYQGIKAQVIDSPAFGSEYFDVGLTNTADCILILVDKVEDLPDLEQYLTRVRGKRIILVNKIDLLTENELRKLKDKIKSKRIRGIAISAQTGENLEELKQMMIAETGMIRIYLKEPGKPPKDQPMVLKEGASLKEVAEGIFKGFAKTVRETRITGPSSKFPNQKVGLTHIVKDKDVVEFHTR